MKNRHFNRLLVVVPTYLPESFGGAEQQTKRLCDEFVSAGIDVSVIAPRLKLSTPGQEDIGGVSIRRIKLGALPNLGGRHIVSFLLWTVRLVYWIYRHQRRIDVIYVVHSRLHAFAPVIAGTFFDIPQVVKLGRGGEGADLRMVRSKKLIGPFVERYLTRHISTFVANSSIIANDLKQFGIAGDRVARIPNGVICPSKELLNVENRSGDATRKFIYAGRFDPEKRLDFLIAGFAELTDRAPCQLTLIGDGRCKDDLVQLVKDLNLQKIVRIESPVSDVTPFFLESHFFVSTSESEGMSNSMLEAMSCAVVPIVSLVSGVEEVVEHDLSGMTFPVSSNVEYNRMLDRALSMEWSDLERMANEARRVVEMNYEISSVAAQYIRLFESQISDTIACE